MAGSSPPCTPRHRQLEARLRRRPRREPGQRAPSGGATWRVADDVKRTDTHRERIRRREQWIAGGGDPVCLPMSAVVQRRRAAQPHASSPHGAPRAIFLRSWRYLTRIVKGCGGNRLAWRRAAPMHGRCRQAAAGRRAQRAAITTIAAPFPHAIIWAAAAMSKLQSFSAA